MAEPEAVDSHFMETVRGFTAPAPADPTKPVRPGSRLTGTACLELFDAQAASRHVDFAARWLRSRGEGFYTIGSAGHEGNAAVAAALRLDDPALLHYRSGAFYIIRGWQRRGHDPVADMLLGLVASAEEPIAGGRHKVFGHHELSVIPQTSTIASHLPRALGLAFAIGRARKLGLPTPWPDDAVVVCSFGDASVNHSTAAGAINAAGWATAQGLPLPLLLVCEDNGIGISVRTPPGWVEAATRDRPGIRYLAADGSDPAQTYDTAADAAEWVRARRRPALLHLTTVRFMAHAGSDVESGYRSAAQITADYRRDPLLGTARALVEAGVVTPDEILGRYEVIREQVLAAAETAAALPRLSSAQQVMAPLMATDPVAVMAAARSLSATAAAESMSEDAPPEDDGPLTLAQSINRTLADAAAAEPGLLVFGEDVAVKGGVYGVTRGLRSRLGAARVFDTLLDEQTILGLALGAGLAGLLPVPEIQYLAYLHNAEDQLRGEAATLQFFSQGRYRNPMVVRIAGYGYQKGFGGHFHNDNSIAVLRDLPGVVVATPARPDDAAAMLRTCLAAARVEGRVCVFVEPIALYHIRDLHEPGDGGWLAGYRADSHAPIGSARCHLAGDSDGLTIVTFGNGLFLSLRVARRLQRAGMPVRVVDLRWLAPLPMDDVLEHAQATGRVLVVDETRRSGGVAEGVLAGLVDAGFDGPMARGWAQDSFVPLGDAANLVLVSESDIELAARRLLAL